MTGEKPMNCEAYHQAGKGSWKDYIFLGELDSYDLLP